MNALGFPKEKTRISYVIGTLGTGGAELQLLELLRHLDSSRFEASLVLFNDANGWRADRLVSEVFCLDWDGLARVIPGAGRDNGSTIWRRAILFGCAFVRLSRYFTRWRPQIVHAVLPMACLVAGPAAKAARVPVVVGSRRALPLQYRPVDRIPARIEQLSMQFIDRMLGNSEAVTRTIIDDGFPISRTRTIYNGVDCHRFHPCRSRAWRQEMGWGDEVVFGTVANFYDNKRHCDVVRAADLIRNSCPNARFILVGEDRGSLSAVRTEISKLGLSNTISIVPGSSTPEDVFAAIDVYICPSAAEGCPNVVLEAMASAKPVIATDVGGNSELVIEGWNGFIVPIGSPEAIAAAARKILSDEGLISTAGMRSRERVEQCFSVERMTEMYHQFYSEILAGSNRQS